MTYQRLKSIVLALGITVAAEAAIIAGLLVVSAGLAEQRDNAEAALGAAIVVINTSSDKICPGWLFDSNLAQAKARICKK